MLFVFDFEFDCAIHHEHYHLVGSSRFFFLILLIIYLNLFKVHHLFPKISKGEYHNVHRILMKDPMHASRHENPISSF